VNLATYARRNLFRRRGRTIMTMIAIALAVLIFSILRTVVFEFHRGAEEAAKDRLAVRHKVSITRTLPYTYITKVRDTKGVKAASWANWFGAKDPKERIPFFAGFAVDQNSWFDVMDDMKVDPAALEAWKKPENKNGAIIGDLLAKTFEVKVGDDITIVSDIFPGDWKFKVLAIYQPLRATVDRNTFIFRWDLLNDDPRATFFGKDQIGWVLARIDDPSKSAAIAKDIDHTFSEEPDQTTTMSEREFQLSFIGGFSALLTAFDYVSIVILLILMLVLVNTIAMSVRERTHEYGVLRAIGFAPKHIVGFIIGEAALIAVVGGAIGVGLTAGLINGMVGPFLENNMANWFPYFSTPPVVMGIAMVAASLMGVVAGAVPAYRASKLKVTDALRRLD
jgi:putative ABC transport system permease protein